MAALAGIRPTWIRQEGTKFTQYSVQPNPDHYKVDKGVADIRRVEHLNKDGHVVCKESELYLRTAGVVRGPKTVWERFTDYAGDTTNGLYQTSKGLRQSLSIITTLAKPEGQVGEVMKNAHVMLSGATNFLIFPRIIGTISKVAHGTSNDSWVDRIHDWAELVGSVVTGWLVLAPVFGKSAAGAEIAGPVCDLVADGIEGGKNAKELAENTQLIREMEADGADAVIVDTVKEKRNLNIFKVIKAVAAVAIAVFSLLALALGAPVVPAIVMLVIGIVSTIFSITSHFYGATRSQNVSKEVVNAHKPEVGVAPGYQRPLLDKVLPQPQTALQMGPRDGMEKYLV